MSGAPKRAVAAPVGAVQSLPIDLIDRSPFQPRREIPPESLERLAESMRRQGQAQPIVVRPSGARFELVCGERRWRAAQLAGIPELMAVVRACSDAQSAELALVENEVRESVNPIDTARAIERLIVRFGYTHEEVALTLSVERSTVTNILRLLTLDPQVQALVGEGAARISAGHAKVLVGLTRAQQLTLAARVLAEALSVRALEKLIKGAERAPPREARDANIVSLETRLTEHLCQPVQIDWVAPAGTTLTIRFSSEEELQGFFERVGFVP